jgi:hypothetical protein
MDANVSERKLLSQLISKGKAKAKTILKAHILLKVDQGEAVRAGPMRRWPRSESRHHPCDAIELFLTLCPTGSWHQLESLCPPQQLGQLPWGAGDGPAARSEFDPDLRLLQLLRSESVTGFGRRFADDGESAPGMDEAQGEGVRPVGRRSKAATNTCLLAHAPHGQGLPNLQ